jgi:hypothetical protein
MTNRKSQGPSHVAVPHLVTGGVVIHLWTNGMIARNKMRNKG